MALTPKDDMAGDAQERILSQYADDPTFMALVAVVGGSPQDLENAIQDLDVAQVLDTAVGVWLTNIGIVVGEARDSWSDSDLRKWIKARILANKSSGTIDEVINVMASAFAITPADLVFSLVEYPPAAALFVLKEGIGLADAERGKVLEIVRKARPAGVRLMINTSDTDAKSFTCSSSDDVQPVIDAGQGFSDVLTPTTGGSFAGGWFA